MSTSLPMSLCLIETAPVGFKGSMARYADLVEMALRDMDSSRHVSIIRINIALPQHILERVPARFRMWTHHSWVFLAAIFRLRLGRRADLYHLLDGSHGYVANLLPASTTVVTAHDIVPLLQMEKVLGGRIPGKGGQLVIRAGLKGLQRSRLLVCDSNSTLNDLKQYAGISEEKMHVIFPALSPDMTSSAQLSPAWHSRRHGDAPFVFHLGHNGFYKNRAAVLRIFAMVHARIPEMKLKMAGPPLAEDLLKLADQLGITASLECINDPVDAAVTELYRHASLLLFPSIYEGFGWPPLEAMAFGTPVVCSSEGSLAEVVADAAMTAPAADETELAEMCLSILNSDDVAESMISKGYQRVLDFQPQQMAEKLLEVYRKVMS